MTAPFNQRDVTKAVRGAVAGGMEIGRVEIDPRTGRIIVLPANAVTVQGDALDEELKGWIADDADG